MEENRIIEEQKLANGIRLLLIDQSRIMAGDRWLVELRCEGHMVIVEDYWSLIPDQDRKFESEVREALGDHLVFVKIKQRNFVDEHERQAVLKEMVQQIQETILAYLVKPHFPQEFFRKRYKETSKMVLLQRAMNRQP